MRLLFVIAIMALSLWASAQQFLVDPATTMDTFGTESMEVTDDGSGDVILIGFAGSYAHMSRHTPTGAKVWSKTCVSNSGFFASAKRPDGNIIAVGFRSSRAFATLFDQDGVVLWAKTFSSLDSVATFTSVVVDDLGFSYAIGNKEPADREIVVKLATDGNINCATQLQPNGSPVLARKALIQNGNLFVFGDGYVNGVQGIGVAKYDLSLTLLGYRVFGGNGTTDNFWDATYYQGGFIFSFWNSNDNELLMLAKMREDLTLDGNAVSFQDGIFGDGIGPLTLGKLSANQDGSLYVSGGMSNNGSNSSVIMKIGEDLGSPLWGRKLLFGGMPIKTFQLESQVGGKVILAKTKNNTLLGSSTGSTITTLSGAGDLIGMAYCQLPHEFTFELWDAGSMITTVQTRSQVSLVLSPLNATFGEYFPRTYSCLVLLPVTLLSFDGKKDAEQVRLEWTTASEHNNHHFNVMRAASPDTDAWEKIGEVEGAGNSLVSIDYGFVDADPLEGTNYYQLQQVDTDGTEHPSGVIAVDFGTRDYDTLALYPNPIRSGQTLGGTGGQAFEVRNSLGQVVFQSSGFETILPDLPTGTYIVRIITTGAFGRVVVND